MKMEKGGRQVFVSLIVVLVLPVLALAGCKALFHPEDPEETNPPLVSGITVSPKTVSVEKGATQKFNADVAVSGGAVQSIIWEIVESHAEGTLISATGFLTVDLNESASKLTVMATSTADNSKTGTAVVTIGAAVQPPSVESVTVSPETVSMGKGGTQTFNADVEVTGGADKSVIWEIAEPHAAGTSISATGLLTIDTNESAASLTVTATSTADNSKSGTAVVTVLTEVQPPSVSSVTVNPKTASLVKGGTQQFGAEVGVSGGAAQTVIWSVAGNSSAGTTISAGGLLTVAANEEEPMLRVEARSTVDGTKYDTAMVWVTAAAPEPTVTSVTVSPKTASVVKGATQQFYVGVGVTGGAAQTVNWTIVEAHLAGTTISAGGLLTVAANENAAALTVRATSTVDNTKYDTASVTIITPSVSGVTVSPKTVTVVKGGSQQFSADVSVTWGAAQTVNWTIVEAHLAGTTISAEGLLTVAANESAVTLTVKAASTVDSSKSDTAVVTVIIPSSVTGITVSPKAVSVVKGGSQQFTADTTVSGGAAQTVNWTVTGNGSSGTTISAGGLLTVAANESAGSLTVKATSTADGSKYDTATVTLITPAVTSVTVNPKTVSVVKGQTQQFSAGVSTSGGAAQTVTWTVTGNGSSGTTISTSGLLTVAANESAGSLTVRATSTADSSRYDTAAVTLITPAISSVTVSPKTPSVLKGQTQQFNAVVSVSGGAAQTVTWTVTGNGSSGTTISATGLLTVAANESAGSLTVRATSTADSSRYDTATVTVTTPGLAGVLETVSSPAENSSYNFVLASGSETMAPKTLSYSGRKVTITIDGQGRTVTLSSTGSLLTVGDGVTLKLRNITLKGRGSGNPNTDALIQVSSGGVLELDDGALITENSTDYGSGGRGVLVEGGTFTMKGNSTVSGNRALGGGGVLIESGIFTMQDSATVSGNMVSGNLGGGVRLGYGTFIMQGNATVSGNTANSGGGVYVGRGTFIMQDNASVNGNTASTAGGSGGVEVPSGTFTMQGNASVRNNYGRGVEVDAGSFTMQDNATVSGNTSSNWGGGVSVNRGTFTKKGGTIYGDINNTHTPDSNENTATNGYGHAIFLQGGKRRNADAGLSVMLYANGNGNWTWTYNDTSAGGVGDTTANWE
jgi:hypothetical protein